MSSNFYGGKEGRSFVITKVFNTVSEMAEKFKLGPDYTEVNFDEYVIINTINKANPENGQVFRRGYDFDSERMIKSYNIEEVIDNAGDKTFINREILSGGALYVGTIVGPAGRAPMFSLMNYEDVMHYQEIIEIDGKINELIKDIQDITDYLIENFPHGVDPFDLYTKHPGLLPENATIKQFPQGEKIYYTVKFILHKEVLPGEIRNYIYYMHLDDKLYSEEDVENSIKWYCIDSPPKVGKDSYSPGHNLVPTVEYEVDENKKIKYEKVNGELRMVVKSHHDTIDWNYISLRNENNEDSTAYVGFKFSSPAFEFYSKNVDAYYHRSDMDESIVGAGNAKETNDFTNVDLIERIDNNEEALEHPFYSRWSVSIPKGIKGESIKNIKVVTAHADVMAFDVDENGSLQYNEIGNILVTDYDGKQDDINNNREIIVYDYVCYDRVPEGEHHIIYLGDYNMIDSLALEDDGHFHIKYSHDDDYVRNDNDTRLHWITDMSFSEDGTPSIVFNDPAWNQDDIKLGLLEYPNLFHWINEMSFEKDGSIKVIFNNTAINNDADYGIKNGVIDLPQFMSWLTSFSIAEKGDIDITFNNQNNGVKDIHLSNYIKRIDKIELQDTKSETDNTSVANNQKIRVTYNTKRGDMEITEDGFDTEEIGSPINYVMRIERDNETNHLLLLHSDPERRKENIAKDNKQHLYDGIDGWQDLGGLGYMMSHNDDNSVELSQKQNALSVGGAWFITKEIEV